MPIYEFRCSRCGREFEELVMRKGDVSDVVCPDCGAGNPERLMSLCVAYGKDSSGETTFSTSPSACSTCSATTCSTCSIK